jgi:hypothetical protein
MRSVIGRKRLICGTASSMRRSSFSRISFGQMFDRGQLFRQPIHMLVSHLKHRRA